MINDKMKVCFWARIFSADGTARETLVLRRQMGDLAIHSCGLPGPVDEDGKETWLSAYFHAENHIIPGKI